MIRLLILALLFYLGYTLLAGVGRLLFGRRPAPPPAHSPEGEEMVRDPHCGTFIPRGDAVSAVIGGERRYFCSTACRDAFRDQA